MSNYLLIYNTKAGHGRAGKMLPSVQAKLAQNAIEFELALTDYPEHAREIAASADFNKYAGILVAGGDGTLFEVINGIFANKSGNPPPLGILPVGTGNAAARDLDLHADKWEQAVDIIAGGKTRKIDAGKFKTHGQDFYFINILGLGFVADVVETACKLKILGNISYTLGVFWRTLRLAHHQLEIEIDGNKYQRDNLFVEVSNTRYTSNFLMAPQAEIDDGFLDVTLANRLTRRRLLKIFPKIFTGEHVKEPEVEVFKAKSIQISANPVKVLTPDGELTGITPVEIECLHKAVEVYWR